MPPLPRFDTIRKKLHMVFGASVLFIGALVIIGLVAMFQMKGASEEMYDSAVTRGMRLMELEGAFYETRAALLMLLMETDPEKQDALFKTLAHASDEIDEIMGAGLQGRADDAASASGLARLRTLWSEFKATREKELFPAVRSGMTDRARRLGLGVQEERFREMSAMASRLAEQEKAMSRAFRQDVEKKFYWAVEVYLLVMAAGLLAAVMNILYLSRDIGKRLGAIARGVEDLKHGGVDVIVEARGHDEIARLAASFNDMALRLNQKDRELGRYLAELCQVADEKDEKARELDAMCKRLAETQAQMVQSEKLASLGQLATGVAHEINNPVGFVKSNLNTLKDYALGMMRLLEVYSGLERCADRGEAALLLEEAKRRKADMDFDFLMRDIEGLFRESEDGLRRVISIVAGLKTFAHKGPEEMGEHDINACLMDALKLARHEIEHTARVEKELSDMPCVACHPVKMGQVFLNLLVNAAQAMPDRGTITLKTFTENGHAVVEIRDTGQGMTEEVKKRVFEPFFTTKPVGQGTGLGLSIAYGIVKEHNGTIDIESEPGKGTTFSIRLPWAHKAGARV